MEALFGDPWLWVPAAASLLAPLAARWRVWAGWTAWGLAVVAACVGFLFVAAATVLIGLSGALFGFAPDWGGAAASFGAPGVASVVVIAGSWHLTRRTAAAIRSGAPDADPQGADTGSDAMGDPNRSERRT